MRAILAVALLFWLAGPAGAQQGLTGALDRQELQLELHRQQRRQEVDRQAQDIQRQLDQTRVQQLIERQLVPRPPLPCPVARVPAVC